MIDEIKFCSLDRVQKARFKDRDGIIHIVDIIKIEWSKSSLVYAYKKQNEVNEYWATRESIQLLTPIMFNNKYIGIGDHVKESEEWYIVYDYRWFDGEYRIEAVRKNGTIDASCVSFYQSSISSHEIVDGFDEITHEMTLSEVCEALGKNIKIIKEQ